MPKLINNYAKATDAIIRGGSKAQVHAARSHVAIAKQLAPVDTGFMRDNIKIEGGTFDESVGQFRHAPSGRFSAPVNLNVISEAEYSSYVEFGTTLNDAQPFFIPAFEAAQRQYRDDVRQSIDNELRSAAVK